MRPDSNEPPVYVYIEGDDSDSLWDSQTCIEVLQCPSPNYDYNLVSEEWEMNQDVYMADLRARRNIELTRIDKYMISDYPISAEDLVIVETYRQDLRDCPNEAVFEDRVLPSCPTECEA